MSRKPKLVKCQTLIPSGLMEEIIVTANKHRRSVSSFVAGIIIEWSNKSKKEQEENGKDKEIN